MNRASRQRVVTLALAVLNEAAYRSRTERVDTVPVRLALAILWCMLSNREGLKFYLERAQRERAPHPWETCREPYNHIAKACRDDGWDAPV